MYRVRPGSQEEKVGRLILAAIVLMVLPNLPLGGFVIFPFTILSTWFHEMGHGLTAMMMGYGFDHLVIFSNGSGYAETLRPMDTSALADALISAAGPLGPVFVGSALILASSRHEWWRPALFSLATVLVLSTVIWVRSAAGLIVLPMIAAALVWIAVKGRPWIQSFALQLLGVLGAMSMLTDWGYLFTERTSVGGRGMYSDTGMMEQALFLPHWFWAIAIIVISALMVGASLKYALNREG